MSGSAAEGRTDLVIFFHNFSSALAFWADVNVSASARLSTAIAKKTFSKMSKIRRRGGGEKS